MDLACIKKREVIQTVKKSIWHFCSLLLFMPLFLAGCSDRRSEPSSYEAVNTLDGIWIEVKEETVTPTGLEIVFHNTTDRDDYFYGAWYALEVYSKGKWLKVNPLPDVEWSQEDWDRRVYTQEKLERFGNGRTEWSGYLPNEMGYDWEWYYGALPRGKYRIVIYLLSDFDKPIQETSPRYYLAANFGIE